MEHPSVTLFREYLRIKTVQPDPDYAECYLFKRLARELELPYTITEMAPGKPIFIMTWKGSSPELPSILLNSHMDVAPVSDGWKHDPFAAVKEENGDIFGRGAQDMKSVAIQYVEAIRRLKKGGKTLRRTVHLCFLPEGYISAAGHGSSHRKRVLRSVLNKLNIILALDGGAASTGEAMSIFCLESNAYTVKFHCRSKIYLSSLDNRKDFAQESIGNLLAKLREYSEEEEEKYERKRLTLGDLSRVRFVPRVDRSRKALPNYITLSFDIRLAPGKDIAMFEDRVRPWIASNDNIDLEIVKMSEQPLSRTAEDNLSLHIFYSAIERQHSGLKVVPAAFPASTDGSVLRQLGVPVLGFTPINHSSSDSGSSNECLSEKTFLRGIDVFGDVIMELANAECL